LQSVCGQRRPFLAELGDSDLELGNRANQLLDSSLTRGDAFDQRGLLALEALDALGGRHPQLDPRLLLCRDLSKPLFELASLGVVQGDARTQALDFDAALAEVLLVAHDGDLAVVRFGAQTLERAPDVAELGLDRDQAPRSIAELVLELAGDLFELADFPLLRQDACPLRLARATAHHPVPVDDVALESDQGLHGPVVVEIERGGDGVDDHTLLEQAATDLGEAGLERDQVDHVAENALPGNWRRSCGAVLEFDLAEAAGLEFRGTRGLTSRLARHERGTTGGGFFQVLDGPEADLVRVHQDAAETISQCGFHGALELLRGLHHVGDDAPNRSGGVIVEQRGGMLHDRARSPREAFVFFLDLDQRVQSRLAPVELCAQRLHLGLAALRVLSELALAGLVGAGPLGDVVVRLPELGQLAIEELDLLFELRDTLIVLVAVGQDLFESLNRIVAAPSERVGLALGAGQVCLGAGELGAGFVELLLGLAEQAPALGDGALALAHGLLL